MTTCMPSCENISYMMLNLVGEVGEFASKLAKAIRREELEINGNNLAAAEKYDDYDFEQLKQELGDILWQASGIASVMGWNLEDIALMNLDKLRSRRKRGVISGDGDNR